MWQVILKHGIKNQPRVAAEVESGEFSFDKAVQSFISTHPAVICMDAWHLWLSEHKSQQIIFCSLSEFLCYYIDPNFIEADIIRWYTCATNKIVWCIILLFRYYAPVMCDLKDWARESEWWPVRWHLMWTVHLRRCQQKPPNVKDKAVNKGQNPASSREKIPVQWMF